MADYEETDTESEFHCSSSSGGYSEDDETDRSDGETLPYQSEPVVSQERLAIRRMETANPEPDPENDRLRDVSWCTCRHCVVMTTPPECLCCREVEKVYEKLDIYNDENATDLMCITNHPGFASVCLDPYVLETAYFQYRQQYGGVRVDNLNERQRYVGYRQLVRWCWGYLGKEVRVTLPACAVTAIRNRYPSDDYRVFQDV